MEVGISFVSAGGWEGVGGDSKVFCGSALGWTGGMVVRLILLSQPLMGRARIMIVTGQQRRAAACCMD
jgi:hypothetical protein